MHRNCQSSSWYCMLQGHASLTLHCVPTLPGRSRVFASLFTPAASVPWPLKILFRHFVCGWWEHMHGGNTILDGDAQLILGQVRMLSRMCQEALMQQILPRCVCSVLPWPSSNSSMLRSSAACEARQQHRPPVSCSL